MINEKIKKLIDYILAKDKNHTLETRILISVFTVSILASIVGSVINLFLTTSLTATIIPLILSVLLIFLYYLIRFKNIIEPIKMPAALIGILSVAIVWVFNGGINGANTITGLIVLMLSLIVVNEKQKKYIVYVFLISMITVYLIQLYKPEWIVSFPTEEDRWIDELITIIYSSIFVYYTINFLQHHYNVEKNRAIESEAKLNYLNQKLIELNNSKDKFFSILAHDLKNPISSFKQISEMLSDDYHDFSEEEFKIYLIELKKSSLSVYELLENLLTWSRSQSGKINISQEVFDLSYLVVSIANLHKLTALKKKISIINKLDKKLNIYADANLINTVIRNLISNAIKFTPEGGTIEIGSVIKPSEGLEPSEGFIQIYVKDSGVGMPKEIKDKLFKIEENISIKGTAGESGTGLGLILCKEFVEMHGGKIWVESEVGQGSTFWISLKMNVNF